VIRIDGSEIYVELNSDLLDRDGDKVTGIAIATDINQRRQADEAIRKSETRFRNLFESVPQISVQG
jgi:PAS domain-containing protein